MTKHSRLSFLDADGIDEIIDSVAADPKMAAHAKSLLHAKVGTDQSVVHFPKAVLVTNDEDDMWDNMPV